MDVNALQSAPAVAEARSGMLKLLIGLGLAAVLILSLLDLFCILDLSDLC